MRKRVASAPSGSASVSSTPTVPSRATPHRIVVSLALALFLPALWLVLNGNLSVQAALVRFIAALAVSWFAAWLVFATTAHSAGSSASPGDAGHTPAPPSPATSPGPSQPDIADAAEPPDDPSTAAMT